MKLVFNWFQVPVLAKLFQGDKTIIGICGELEPAVDAGVGKKWPQSGSREAQSSATFRVGLHRTGRALIIAQELFLTDLNAEAVLFLTGRVHRLYW